MVEYCTPVNSVAGQGYRPLVKQDYEPCKILTFHPHNNEHLYYSTRLDGMVKYWESTFCWVAMAG